MQNCIRNQIRNCHNKTHCCNLCFIQQPERERERAKGCRTSTSFYIDTFIWDIKHGWVLISGLVCWTKQINRIVKCDRQMWRLQNPATATACNVTWQGNGNDNGNDNGFCFLVFCFAFWLRVAHTQKVQTMRLVVVVAVAEVIGSIRRRSRSRVEGLSGGGGGMQRWQRTRKNQMTNDILLRHPEGTTHSSSIYMKTGLWRV